MNSANIQKLTCLGIAGFVFLGMILTAQRVINDQRSVRNEIRITTGAKERVAENSNTEQQNPQNQADVIPEEETLEGYIVQVTEEKEVDTLDGKKQKIQKLEVNVTKGSLSGKKIEFENGIGGTLASPNAYKAGDKVVLTFIKDPTGQGNDIFVVTDYQRRQPMLILFIIFVALTLFVARWKGLSSLVGMAISFVIIFKFVLPQIINGRDPILIAVLASCAIIPFTFFMSHGLNKKTSVAVFGTLFSLIVTGILALIFVNFAKITGSASEEASFLQLANRDTYNLKGLFLASIIIGSLGILDDITVSQAAIVEQLKEASPKMAVKELYSRAMAVGRDHIASLVNTLILVYTGAALPLLILFVNSTAPFDQVVNYEIVAEEIVRTLIGSIGLVLAVPITTLVATLVYDRMYDSKGN